MTPNTPFSPFATMPPTPRPDLHGCWVHDEGGQLVVGATTRQRSGFLLVLVSIFIPWSYGGQLIIGRLSLGDIFWCVPGLIFCVLAAMAMAGKVEVVLRGRHSQVFTGIGRLGWTRAFDASRVTGAVETNAGWSDSENGPQRRAIRLEGVGIRFGSLLNDERRNFVLRVLGESGRRLGPQSGGERDPSTTDRGR